MIILGIDTSGREGSLALCNGDASSFDVLELVTLTGGSYSAELVPQLAAALERRNLTNPDIDLFAVASGPGSFTGLRVGLSSVKAFAEVLRKPVVALTVLEAIAVTAVRSGAQSMRRIACALDASRNEVYAGEYEPRGKDVVKISEKVIPIADFIAGLNTKKPAPVTFTPDAAIAEQIRTAGLAAGQATRPAADTIARIGLSRFLEGRTVAVEELDAEYIRRSDAEIFAKK